MAKENTCNSTRRQFITRVIPACAATCVGLSGIKTSALFAGSASMQDDIHKFDQKLDRNLTYRQYMTARLMGVIEIAKALEKELGKDRTIAFLKKHTTERMTAYGKNQAAQSPDNSFRTYTDTFRNKERWKNISTMEIVEDTEHAFELKFTECIWADIWLKADAGDLGFAYVCFGDYAWIRGFNPAFKMVRDKTLMQGDRFCNHRYLWEV